MKQVRVLVTEEEVQLLRFVTVNLSRGIDVSKATKHPQWAGIVSKIREAEQELQDPKVAERTGWEETRHRLLKQGYTEREVEQILSLSRRP